MTESSTDRMLFALFIVVAILAIIVYFTRGVATTIVRPVTTTTWRTTAPASAGSVVRAVSPVSSTRATYSNSTNYTQTYSNTIPGGTTTTTYYETY